MSDSALPAAPIVEPRPAASLLVLRSDPNHVTGQTQVLMGMRGAGHRFMPNRLVFPGGAVDPGDATAASATPLPGHVLALLSEPDDPALAHGLAIAAARELEEETGLSLGAPPALHAMDYLCRAVTPETSPVRFDARFLVVGAEHVGGSLGGSGELENLRWYGLDEALGMDLVLVTGSVIRQLMLWLEMSAAERMARDSVPVMRDRRWVG